MSLFVTEGSESISLFFIVSTFVSQAGNIMAEINIDQSRIPMLPLTEMDFN
jgi:hypothetical protein